MGPCSERLEYYKIVHRQLVPKKRGYMVSHKIWNQYKGENHTHQLQSNLNNSRNFACVSVSW